MPVITKPINLSLTWASAGDVLDPGNTKYASGWSAEIPPRQWFNYIDNRQDEAIAHINQHGVAVWDADTEYQINKSYVQGDSNGTIYRCKQTHTNQRPEDDVANTYWQIAFASAGDFYTKTEADGRYAEIANNGSDFTNTATFRTNLSLYSQAELYTRTEVDSKTTKASKTQAEAGSSDAVLMTPLRTEQWGSANLLGLGQSWVNVASTRAFSTTYTNTTGRPIFVSIAVGNVPDTGISLTVSGVLVARTGVSGGDDGNRDNTVSAVVPHGATYSAATLGTGTILIWAELR